MTTEEKLDGALAALAELSVLLGQTLTAVGELTQTMTAVLAKMQEQLASQRQKD